jgi:hypothetical protein
VKLDWSLLFDGGKGMAGDMAELNKGKVAVVSMCRTLRKGQNSPSPWRSFVSKEVGEFRFFGEE